MLMMTFTQFQAAYPALCEQRVRLVVGDDSIIGQAGMRELMQQPPCLQVLAVTATREELLAACRAYRPELVVLDLCFPLATDGLATCRAVRREFPQTRVLIATGSESARARGEAREAGASGYALKQFSNGLLWKCALEIASGRETFPASEPGWLAPELTDAQKLALLAPHEVELLAAFAALVTGNPLKQHGAIKELFDLKPGYSEPTVRDILERIRRKLGCRSLEAAQWYAQLAPQPGGGPAERPRG